MYLTNIDRAALRVAAALLVCSVVFAQSSPRFDSQWLTTVTCPAKGKTEGYKLHVPSVIQDSNFRREYGTPGEPGYLLIEGKVKDSGTARLSATRKVSSRKYGTGIFTT